MSVNGKLQAIHRVAVHRTLVEEKQQLPEVPTVWELECEAGYQKEHRLKEQGGSRESGLRRQGSLV